MGFMVFLPKRVEGVAKNENIILDTSIAVARTVCVTEVFPNCSPTPRADEKPLHFMALRRRAEVVQQRAMRMS